MLLLTTENVAMFLVKSIVIQMYGQVYGSINTVMIDGNPVRPVDVRLHDLSCVPTIHVGLKNTWVRAPEVCPEHHPGEV